MEQQDTAPGQAWQQSERYWCPAPGCKRSFAELWRLKVHYRAPPDIRGSGKERGHGTELTHCPKCGKGLKPGKHHVGCSGSKAGPRQNKRSRLAGASSMGLDGMQQANNMYTLQMQYRQPASNGMTPQLGTTTGFQQQPQQQQQYVAQQYQPDLSGGMYTGQQVTTQTMAGSLPQQVQGQPQQQQSPALSMGILPDQLTDGGAGAVGQTLLSGAGASGDANMGFYHQQQPLQQQLSLEGMGSLQPMQQQPGQMQDPMAAAQHVAPFGMTASAAFIQGQAHQQGQQQQQLGQADASGLYSAGSGVDAAAAAAGAPGGMMLPPQPMQMQQVAAMQQGVGQQQPSPQLVPGLTPVMSAVPQPGSVQLAPAGSGALLLQPQQQQQVGAVPNQQQPQAQQLFSPSVMPQQQMQQPQMQMQAQQVVSTVAVAAPTLAHAGSGSLQSVTTSMQPPAPAPQQNQQQLMQPPPVQQQQHMQGATQAPAAQAQQQMPPPAPINVNLFDEIDGGFDFAHPPSPPPLPADFPAASATLFNFNQFSQKLPAAAGPSQQMAMMPRGMEQELPPSMDELWTPEATYDHHSDGDLMQLLFGAPEQPPTMATIHLHHFLDDDACSSPGLLAGILGGSMDDLPAAAAAGGQAGAGEGAGGAGAGAAGAAAAGAGQPQGSSAMVAPPLPGAEQHAQGAPAAAAALMQQEQQQHPQQQAAAFVPMGVKAEPQQLGGMPATAGVVAPQQHQQQQQHQQLLPQQHVMVTGSLQPQQVPVQDCNPQLYQQQVYGSVAIPQVNGMNGSLNCVVPGTNGMLPPGGQCASAALQVHMSMQLSVQQQELAAGGAGGPGGMVAIKAEDEQAMLMQQKAAVAAASLPGAMASRAN